MSFGQIPYLVDNGVIKDKNTLAEEEQQQSESKK